MSHFALRLSTLLLSAILALCWTTSTFAAVTGEGTDIEFGGPGDGPGQFLALKDMTFDQQNTLYTLEGGDWSDQTRTAPGNYRVQKFDDTGKFLAQFSVRDETLVTVRGDGQKQDRNDPQRIAVDSKGNIYVTQPQAGFVQQFDNTGKLVKTHEIPHALGITTWTRNGKEVIAVISSWWERNQNNGGDQVYLIDPATGTLAEPVKLEKAAPGCIDVAARDGKLYILAEVNQLYIFDENGKLLKVVGGRTYKRIADGSELQHSVAVDSQGNIYAEAWGQMICFDPDITGVMLRENRFAWNNNWSPHGAYLFFTIDQKDRLWAGVTGISKGDRGNGDHIRPCVVRTRTDYYKNTKPQSTLLMGLDAVVAPVGLVYNIAYDLAPITLNFQIKAGFRQVRDVTMQYVVYDAYKNAVAKGQYQYTLEDGKATEQSITFTPPKYGWYTVECAMTAQGKLLMSVGTHVGVTPKFAGMPVLAEGEALGGWNDIPRLAFAGLGIHRIHSETPDAEFDKMIQLAEKYGIVLMVQVNEKDCTADGMRALVTKYKGRVKYWEIINEPNFSMSPERYAEILKLVYPIIHEVDPQAKVMGPTVCGINLDWNERVFKAGGNKCLDIVSIHDYEGNESMDPEHWRWKITQLREIMKRYGIEQMPIWQTERGFPAVRANTLLSGGQALRVTLQRDVMETLGIPSEHNHYYYMNEAGYGDYPSFLWSNSGPHASVLALRTRQAMIRERKYQGTIDFGPTGNKLFLGLRYDGADGSTITLRQYGADHDLPITLNVTGATLEVVDSFGNSQLLPVKKGQVTVTVPVLPVYLRLAKGQQVTVPGINFGRNLAPDATFAYTGKTKSDMAILTDGLYQNPHGSDPWGTYWSGELPEPKELEITFPQPRAVSKMLVFSNRADNPHSTLLDFDVQAFDGKKWVTVKEVRTPCPETDAVRTSGSVATMWYMDQNMAVVEFPVVTTSKLRIVALRTTQGFMADVKATDLVNWIPGGKSLHLREIEIYGPDAPVSVSAKLPTDTVDTAFTSMPITVTVKNSTKKAMQGSVKLTLPEGWTTNPAALPVKVGKGADAAVKAELIAPTNMPAGRISILVSLVDAKGKVLDYTRLVLAVKAPVQLTTKMPSALNAQQQPMTIDVKNLTDKPVSGTVSVTMSGADNAPAPVQAEFAAIPAGGSKTVDVLVPGLQLTEAAWKATYAVTVNNLITTAEQQFAAMRLWQVVGPFPMEFDTAFPPEKGVDVAKSVALPDGKQVNWKPVSSDANGFVNLNAAFTANENVCAYAVVYVKSPTARKATFSAGSDDGIKAWLNGKEVVSNNTSRGAAPGQEQVAVDLKAGWNEVLLKITQGNGGWGYYFDFLTPDAQLMTDLVYKPTRD